MKNIMTQRLLTNVVAAAMLAGSLSACVPILMGGAAVGGSLVVYDRRTSGAQLEDEGIELRGASRIRGTLGDRVHVNVHSYNRQVLLTGEVPSEKDKQLVEQIISGVDNVSSVVNELAVMTSPGLAQRSNDALITGRVKAALVDTKDLFANSFQVVTERGTTYLMGRVTQREADRGTAVAQSIPGVRKVVRIFEIITEAELAQMLPTQAKQPAAKPSTANQ
jgi:osmotically-inducible protein OsmY